MAVIKKTKNLLIIASSLVSQKAMSLELSKLKFVLNFFDQEGKSGNQIYDNSGNENLTVFEPTLFVEAKVDQETNISANFVFDTWTAASDTALDGNTGASGAGIKNQSRISGQLGYKKGNEQNNWSTRLGVSSEYDYQSLNFGGTILRSFAEDNFTLAITPQLYIDQAKNFDLKNYKTTDFKGRTIYSMDISAAQILTVSDVVQFGYTYIGMNGMMNGIASSVKVQDEILNPYKRQSERLPSDRKRHAVSTKWVHGFSDEMAMHVSYRYYQDDWDISAHTPEIGLRLSFLEADAFLMPSFRYHNQEKAKFFKREFATSEAHMTSDPDLDKFSSKRYGIHYSQGGISVAPFGFKSDMELTGAAYYTDRSNELSYVVLQTGVGLTF